MINKINKINLKQIGFYFIVIVLFTSCYTGAISGRVSEEGSYDKSIEGVKVTLGETTTTYTDSNGEYSFSELQGTTYYVSFEKDGFESSFNHSIEVMNDEETVNASLKKIEPKEAVKK